MSDEFYILMFVLVCSLIVFTAIGGGVLIARWLGVELDPTRPDRDTRKNRHHKTTI